ncbi:hypothetical protein ACFC14_07025 [Microbacterium sp. NPDC055988]|uniref:hypothetical protein n=1 Tax=Microbacterium sp. NPDC055988 TaxID=3345671 RepID=UPI0035D99528
MNIHLPTDLPLWLGWILFAASGIMWLLLGVSRLRADSAQTVKHKRETLKIELDMLADQAAQYTNQLAAIREALQADADIAPTDSQIDTLASIGEAGSLGYASVARHLRARARARLELPAVIARVSAVQLRQVEMSKSLGLGVGIPPGDLSQIRTDLASVGSDLAALIKEIAESPRIFVGTALPGDPGNEGDIFLQIPGPEGSS